MDAATRVLKRLSVIRVLAAMMLGLSTALGAQGGTDSTVVVVAVITPTGASIANANVAISKVPIGAFLAKRTNELGVARFEVVPTKDRHTVLVRIPGWAPQERVLEFGRSDSIHVAMQLEAVAADLDPVVIEASRSNYVLDALQIARSRRPVRDALEALQKLKPSMLYDRDRCRAEVVENVWINGRRVLFMASQIPILGGRSTRTVGTMSIRTPGGQVSAEPPAVDSVLASIRAEHVQDIRLVNCWDTSMPGVGSNNALYVSLKPGVDWDWKRGSFVPDSLRPVRR